MHLWPVSTLSRPFLHEICAHVRKHLTTTTITKEAENAKKNRARPNLPCAHAGQSRTKRNNNLPFCIWSFNNSQNHANIFPLLIYTSFFRRRPLWHFTNTLHRDHGKHFHRLISVRAFSERKKMYSRKSPFKWHNNFRLGFVNECTDCAHRIQTACWFIWIKASASFKIRETMRNMFVSFATVSSACCRLQMQCDWHLLSAIIDLF